MPHARFTFALKAPVGCAICAPASNVHGPVLWYVGLKAYSCAFAAWATTRVTRVMRASGWATRRLIWTSADCIQTTAFKKYSAGAFVKHKKTAPFAGRGLVAWLDASEREAERDRNELGGTSLGVHNVQASLE